MAATIDEYIAGFPPNTAEILRQVRATMHAAVPDGEETITYGIPTITLGGKYVVYFAGWKHHISVYPVPVGDEALQQAVEPYKAAKGTLKFPLAKPIPYDLIARVAVELAQARRAD